MKKMMTALAAMTLVLGAAGCKEQAEDDATATADAGTIAGQWKVNVDSAQWENDDFRLTLADGQYRCESCIPPYGFAADGQWQTVDRPASDSEMMQVVDERTVRAATRKGGKDTGSETLTVSEDGKTMTINWVDLTGTEQVTGSISFNRKSAAPAGSHAVSGEWAVASVENVSDAGLVFDFALDGNTLTNSGNGMTYSATFGGEPVPIEGNIAGTMVAVEKTGENSFRETYTVKGKTVSVTDLTVNGNTLTAKSTDPRDGSVVTWTATRQ